MSRAKHAVKSASILDESTERQYQAKRYGEKCDRDALTAIRALHNSIYRRSTSEAINAQIVAKDRDTFFEYIKSNYQKSWFNHHGSFFRKLADAMEVHQRPVEPHHTVFIGEIQDRKVRGMSMPTVSEMYRLISDAEISVTRKTVERLFRMYNVTPAKGKRGPKPGTKQESVHRRLRS